MVVVGSVGVDGRVWASQLVGKPALCGRWTSGR